VNPDVMTAEQWVESLEELPENASPRARERADSKLADQEMSLFRTAQEQLG